MGGGESGGFQPDGAAALGLAGLATAISLVISGVAIYKHLAHYSIPRCVDGGGCVSGCVCGGGSGYVYGCVGV